MSRIRLATKLRAGRGHSTGGNRPQVMGDGSLVSAVGVASGAGVTAGVDAVTQPVPESLIFAQDFTNVAVGTQFVHDGFYGGTSSMTRFRFQKSNSAASIGEIVNSVSYEGDRCYRSFVPAKFTTDSGAYRADLSISGGLQNITNWEGIEWFVGFAMRLGVNFPVNDPDPQDLVAPQMHNIDWLPPNYEVSPCHTLRIKTGSGTYNPNRKWIDANTGARHHASFSYLGDNQAVASDRGQWVRWVFHVKHSSQKQGFIRFYRNDQLVASLDNVETYPPEPGFGYFLLSNYRAGMRYKPGMATEIFYDSVRIALVTPFNGNPGGGTYATVDPKSYQSTLTPNAVSGLSTTGRTTNSITVAWQNRPASELVTHYQVKVGKATANNVPAADPEETITTQTSPYTLGSIT